MGSACFQQCTAAEPNAMPPPSLNKYSSRHTSQLLARLILCYGRQNRAYNQGALALELTILIGFQKRAEPGYHLQCAVAVVLIIA